MFISKRKHEEEVQFLKNTIEFQRGQIDAAKSVENTLTLKLAVKKEKLPTCCWCEVGALVFDGGIFESLPPQYDFKCSYCGARAILKPEDIRPPLVRPAGKPTIPEDEIAEAVRSVREKHEEEKIRHLREKYLAEKELPYQKHEKQHKENPDKEFYPIG